MRPRVPTTKCFDFPGVARLKSVVPPTRLPRATSGVTVVPTCRPAEADRQKAPVFLLNSRLVQFLLSMTRRRLKCLAAHLRAVEEAKMSQTLSRLAVAVVLVLRAFGLVLLVPLVLVVGLGGIGKIVAEREVAQDRA